MVFFGDKLIRWDERAPESEIPDLKQAIQRYQSRAKQQNINTLTDGEEIPWNSWRIAIAYAQKHSFENILDFLVNVPSLQEQLLDDRILQKWYWNQLPQSRLAERFRLESNFDDEKLSTLKLKELKLDEPVQFGWTLLKEYGRVDEDVTWAEISDLLETENFYIYMHSYVETLH